MTTPVACQEGPETPPPWHNIQEYIVFHDDFPSDVVIADPIIMEDVDILRLAMHIEKYEKSGSVDPPFTFRQCCSQVDAPSSASHSNDDIIHPDPAETLVAASSPAAEVAATECPAVSNMQEPAAPASLVHPRISPPGDICTYLPLSTVAHILISFHSGRCAGHAITRYRGGNIQGITRPET